MGLHIYYVCIDHKKEGPFLISDLLKIVREKKLSPKTLVWTNFKGMEDNMEKSERNKRTCAGFQGPSTASLGSAGKSRGFRTR
jgi:hypothetical protein